MVKKIVLKIVVAIVLTVLISFVSNSLMPILCNDIALGQLQHDDAYFLAMEAWYRIHNWLGVATAIVWLIVTALIGKDIYNAIKIHNVIKNTKENIQ